MNPACFLTSCLGYDMSTFIRRYGRYLNEKAFAYRQMAFDFTRVKKGWVNHVQRGCACRPLLPHTSTFYRLDSLSFFFYISNSCSHLCEASNALLYSLSAEGVMRTMTTEKLLKGMPVLQTQIDTLLEFDVSQTLARYLHITEQQHRTEGFPDLPLFTCSLPPLRFIPRSWTMGSSMLRSCFSSRIWSNCSRPTTTASSTY